MSHSTTVAELESKPALKMIFFFKIFFFLMWTIFKVFTEFVTILLLFYVFGFLAVRHVGSWLPDQGWYPHPLHWTAKS